MNFSAFSDDDFDPKAWVNEALRSESASANGGGAADTATDSHASGLVLKLQMYITEVNNSLESTSAQVVDDLPRVIRSVDMIHQEVSSLKERIGVVKEDVERVERDTADSMKLVVELDEVKARMEGTSSALQEADNWDSLSAEVDDAFESNDLPRISSTLLGMQRSLMVLLDVPDYEQRQARLAALQNKLEEVVGPLLTKAFVSRNEADARAYILALRDVGREDKVNEHYVKCHTTAAQKQWAELCGDEAKSLVAILQSFYTALGELWQQEIAWSEVLFGDEATAAVARLLAGVLKYRTPTVESLLEEDFEAGNTGAEQLDRVLQSFETTVTFANSLDLRDPELDSALFSPFFAQQRQYRRLQSLELQHSIPVFTKHADEGEDSIASRVNSVRAFIPTMMAQMRLAVSHCIELTAGTAVDGLIFCLNEYMSRIADKLLAFSQQISRANDDDERASSEFAFGLLETSGLLFTELTTFEAESSDKLAAATESDTAITKFASLYLGPEKSWREEVLHVAKGLRRGSGLLQEGRASLEKLNTALHDLAYHAVLSPLKANLKIVASNEAWTASGEDTFSLSPMPYITTVGEQFLTLPQQLEPFVTQDGTDLLLEALRAGPLPDALALPSDFDGSTVDHWLESVGCQLALLYLDEIYKIEKLSIKGCAQLSADIEYLCNVMSALDIAPPMRLLQTNQLVAMGTDELVAMASDDLPGDLVSCVKKMRGLP